MMELVRSRIEDSMLVVPVEAHAEEHAGGRGPCVEPWYTNTRGRWKVDGDHRDPIVLEIPGIAD